jgi:hypothetical protein
LTRASITLLVEADLQESVATVRRQNTARRATRTIEIGVCPGVAFFVPIIEPVATELEGALTGLSRRNAVAVVSTNRYVAAIAQLVASTHIVTTFRVTEGARRQEALEGEVEVGG